MSNPQAFSTADHPHRRLNALTGEYVLVSPHRSKRPWQGQTETPPQTDRPNYDANCYLCPGNTRKSGDTNPEYDTTFVFTNDFSALLPDVPNAPASDNPLLQIDGVRGTCRVICFSPRHDLTLARMAIPDIRTVVDLWASQTTELGAQYRWVQVFENRGEMMGSSNPHPHGQIWAEDTLPNIVLTEHQNQRAYYEKHGSNLLLDYVALEQADGTRTLVENDSWLIVVPFWALWPFETLILPKTHTPRMTDLNEAQRDDLAAALKTLLVRYDNLFEISFPYSMGWHGQPFGDEDADSGAFWQLHAHFYPPLLRSATVRKFMVGYEMLGEAQRDLTPEQAADRLRAVSAIHYTERT